MTEKRGFRSISRKLTIFYSIALALLLTLLFLFIYYFSSRMIEVSSRPLMERAVSETINEMTFDDNTILISEDTDLFHEGVTIAIYDSTGESILGSPPDSFPQSLAFINDRHRQIDGNVQWNVYDRYLEFEGTGLWVRGYYALDQTNSFLQNVTRALIISFPLLIILVIIIGYLITKRTLEPLARLTDEVNQIQGSKDLSLRVSTGDPSAKANEITELATDFNHMMNRIQSSFQKEQQFSSDASHELRTPVAAIMAQTEAGLMPSADLADKNHSLERIQVQARNMDTLVNQLLELTRADRGTAEVNFERVDFSELAEMVHESLLDKAESANIDLRLAVEPDIFVNGDPILLMRLIINLANNGIKYGTPGGYVSINLRKESGQALLSVTDNGIGIAEENQQKVFDRFYRVSKDRSRSGDNNTGEYSSGLGLSMVEWIVETHEGRIVVNSTPGVGSQFITWLPLA